VAREKRGYYTRQRSVPEEVQSGIDWGDWVETTGGQLEAGAGKTFDRALRHTGTRAKKTTPHILVDRNKQGVTAMPG